MGMRVYDMRRDNDIVDEKHKHYPVYKPKNVVVDGKDKMLEQVTIIANK